MLNDYKGETPSNVITKEQHEKRPFYRKVSFWVLSALGLFFGGCSVYGLVLGYQYVHAVTEAAHIIADANSSSVEEYSLHKSRNNLITPSGYNDSTPFNLAFDTTSNGKYFFLDGTETNTGSFLANVPMFYIGVSGTRIDAYIQLGLNATSTRAIFISDYCSDLVTNGDNLGWNIRSNNSLSINGVFHFKPVDYAYQNGFDDGSDTINVPQSVKVLLPVGNEYSVQYKSYVDGVVDRQGQLSSSQSGGAYSTFDRSRNQKLRIDLTVPSGSRAFFLYSPSWTSSYPTDENYSLRQSWAVSGVTYLPTWVGKPQVYVNVTSADVPDLTYETISVSFDVDHWGDIKVGAYSQGYTDGYQAGQENPTAYDSGYDAGYEQGFDDGHTLGVAQGESQAVSGQKALVNMFVTAFQQPFDQIYRFLNFNVLGLNILALFTALLTLSIGIIIIKKVI